MCFQPEHGLEQQPGSGVEIFEEARIEHDAGGIAVAPFDDLLPAVDERRHADRLRYLVLRLAARLRLRGSVHSTTSCASNSIFEERRRLRIACLGATAMCGEASSSSISQCNSSSAVTQRLGAKRANENGLENASIDFLPPGRAYSWR